MLAPMNCLRFLAAVLTVVVVIMFVLVLYVCFSSVPSGGDTLAYNSVCCPDLFALFFTFVENSSAAYILEGIHAVVNCHFFTFFRHDHPVKRTIFLLR